MISNASGRAWREWWQFVARASGETSAILVTLFCALGADDADCQHCSGVRGNPAAHVLPGEFASEHWEFTARFDSGHLLFVEFILTNIGLGDRNAAVFGHIIPPGGKPHRFSNGRTERYWTLSPDRLRMEVGTSLLDMHTPTYKMQVTKRSVRLELQITPDARPLWSDTLAPPGYALDLLALAAPIEGTLWVKGMTDPLTSVGLSP